MLEQQVKTHNKPIHPIKRCQIDLNHACGAGAVWNSLDRQKLQWTACKTQNKLTHQSDSFQLRSCLWCRCFLKLLGMFWSKYNEKHVRHRTSLYTKAKSFISNYACGAFWNSKKYAENHIRHETIPHIKVKASSSGHACCAGTGEGWLVPYRGHRRDDRGGLSAYHRQKEEHLQAGTRWCSTSHTHDQVLKFTG